MAQRKLWSGGALALLAVIFVGLVILVQTLLSGWRLDLTEGRQYTLSDGTRNLLATLEEPVTLQLFFSEEASRDLPQVRSYARWVGELLDEMAEASNGKLEVRRINPSPFSPEEDQAARFGLQGVPVGTAGDTLYFGLAGENSLDDAQAIPFLQPSKEQFFEYDVAKMVSSLSHPEPRRVGLLSGLDIAPGMDMQTGQPRPGWVIHEQLSQLFEVEEIPREAGAIPDDIELLLIVHPTGLSEALLYAIDQFVLAGGKLVAFMDPMAETDVGDDPADPMARLNAGGSSTLGALLEAWGVEFDATRVVGDQLLALQVSPGAGAAPVRHLAIISVTRDGMNQDDIVSADLESVNFASTGWLQAAAGASTKFQPLLESSEFAAPIDAGRLRFLANPQDLAAGFQPSGDHYAFAARISGSARSAFAAAPDGGADTATSEAPDDAADTPAKSETSSAHREAAGPDGINVILFADTDVLSDRLWVNRQAFFGQSLLNSFADNGSLVVNAVDNLLGSSDLISIRTRSASARPFNRVERLRLAAESQFLATEERLNQELQDTEQKLAEMQAGRTEGDLGIFNEAQQQEVQRFLDQRIQIRSELRQVRHELDREIDALGTRLKLLNIVVLPLLVIGAALWLGRRRRVRREEAQA